MEHLDVLVVGAGLSGVGAAHYLQDRCPWATFAVFEARDAVGGTWDLFRYPGIRSDSDMFTLGYSFRPWPGAKALADGESIRAYIRDTAAASGVDRRIRFRHKVVRAEWSTPEARWQVTAERTDTGETVELTCDFLFSCTGYYRYEHGYEPEFPGAADFAGPVVHPQRWPEDLEVAGRRVVVIGSGATAVTLVPALADAGARVTMLQRSPTYVVSLPNRDPLTELLRRVLPAPVAGPVIRWTRALLMGAFYQLSRRRPELVKRIVRKGLERLLPAGYDIDTHFTPSYQPWDQRMCFVPDADLFRALGEGSADVVTDRIERFTAGGIALASGRELAADVIVTATGLDLLFLGGMDVVVDGEKVDPGTRLTYKGMMLEGVPNLAMALGYTNASWTLKSELTCRYVCRLLNHLHERGLRQCTAVNRDPSMAAQPAFGLTAGYVQRAVDRIPKQGTAFPWQVHQSYLRDYLAMERSGLHDEAMVFSNPTPVAGAAR